MHDDGYFGERIAAIYDGDTAAFDPSLVDPIVDFLAVIAPSTTVLEFGIDTGRIALPPSRKGIGDGTSHCQQAVVAENHVPLVPQGPPAIAVPPPDPARCPRSRDRQASRTRSSIAERDSVNHRPWRRPPCQPLCVRERHTSHPPAHRTTPHE